jgi:hypothetical protein
LPINNRVTAVFQEVFSFPDLPSGRTPEDVTIYQMVIARIAVMGVTLQISG